MFCNGENGRNEYGRAVYHGTSVRRLTGLVASAATGFWLAGTHLQKHTVSVTEKCWWFEQEMS